MIESVYTLNDSLDRISVAYTLNDSLDRTSEHLKWFLG